MPNGNVVVFMEGLQRIRIEELLGLRPFLRANIVAEPDVIGENDNELEALERNAQDLFRDVVSHSPQLSDDLQNVAMNIEDPSRLSTSSPEHSRVSPRFCARSCWRPLMFASAWKS